MSVKENSFEDSSFLAGLMDGSTEMMFVKDVSFRYLFVNEPLARFFGRDKKAILGKRDAELLPLDALASCVKSDKETLRTQTMVISYERAENKTYQTRKFPLKLPNGEIGIGGIIANVTDRMGESEKIIREKKRMELIVEASQIALWDWDIENDIVAWDARCFTMLGYKPFAFKVNYATWKSMVDPSYAVAVEKKLRKQLKERKIFSVEFPLRRADGSFHWIEGRGRVVEYKEDGTPKRAVGVHIDKQEARQATEALLKHNLLLQKLSDLVPGVIYQYRHFPDGRSCFPFASSHIKEIYELSPEEVREDASVVFKRIHPEDRRHVIETITASYETLAQWQCDYRVVLPSRGVRWLSGIAMPEKLEDGSVLWHGNIRDITEYKQTQESFKKEHHLLSEFMKNSNALIAIKDTQGVYQFVNNSWEEGLGLSGTFVLGKKDEEIFPESIASYFKRHDSEVRASKEVMVFEEKIDSGEEVRYFSFTKFIIKDENGAISGICSMITETTEQRHIEETLRRAYANLEEATNMAHTYAKEANEANRAKSSFLANMTHEIRTPMSAIVGLSELMKETSLDAKQKAYVDQIIHSSSMLLGIINDILDFSKIEANKIELEYTPTDPKALLEHVQVLFEHMALKKKIRFTCKSLSELPALIRADGLRLSQILTNFVSNAIKFTAKGSVDVTLEVLERNEKEVSLRFEVKDTGIGMSKEQLERLFKPFSQADSSITRQYGGSGLGLSIAKRLAELMGAEVSVASRQNEGSIFAIEGHFEVLAWSRETRPLEAKAEASECLKGLRLLVVEDNEINQEVIRAMLEKKGVVVRMAHHGKEAVEIFTREKAFDLILMDLQMPVMGGYEATQKIRESNRTVPIIALTAAATSEDKQKALESGMNDYLTKPISPKRLYEVLERHCTTGLCEEVAKNEVLDEAMVLDKQRLHEVFDGNETLYTQLLGQFYTQLQTQFSDIVAHVKEEKPDVRTQIHTLKGVSGNLGATELSQVCTQIDACYKAQKEVDEALIARLEKALLRLKNELVTLHVLPRAVPKTIPQNDILHALDSLQKKLEESELIEPDEHLGLLESLRSKVDEASLLEWASALERLDYAKALVIMQGWKRG